MLRITIPGRETLDLQHAVFDFNGTLAMDGKVPLTVREGIKQLAHSIQLHVITADTNGTVAEECADLPIHIHVIAPGQQAEQKAAYTKDLSGDVVVFGNGSNDELMFQEAALAIAILGTEGCATSTLLQSDMVVPAMENALELFFQTNRLIATLRK